MTESGTTIELNHITKIEGHASLTLRIRDGQVEKCQLSSIEGARYFEGILRGRHFEEAFEVSSRICGICSCAHVVAAVTAIERALGHTPTEQTIYLRELLTLAERIRSHATHLYFLALPDYLGFESALAMLPEYKLQIQRALRLMKIGNDLVSLIGGRDLHPVTAHPGGFTRVPSTEQLREFALRLDAVIPDAIETVNLFAPFKGPALPRSLPTFSLKDPNEYAMLNGSMHSKNANFPQEAYLEFLHEYHDPSSTANFVVAEGKAYQVGSLARLNNNADQLLPLAAKCLRESGMSVPNYDLFANNLAQAIELVHSCEHAQNLCQSLNIEPQPPAKIPPREGRGVAAIEVPRGTLWHEYILNSEGIITHANIITPTAQNLRAMNEDIAGLVPTILHKPKEDIILDIEKLIRSYDPCFSCSSHFLQVTWE